MSMQPFTTVRGPATPLMLANVDTDVIVRIERLTTLGREQLGPYAFEALRRREDGSDDPACILNDTRFRGAPFLLAGPNFGCGSSREGAAFAVMDFGLRALVGPSFGEIFQVNCIQNGILAITFSEVVIQDLWRQLSERPGAPITIDLPNQMLVAPDRSVHAFNISALRKDRLLRGIDDIDVTLSYRDQIERFEADRRAAVPWLPTMRRE